MSPLGEKDDNDIDPTVSCAACDAVCCRLTVVVMPTDRVPRHLVARGDHGLEVMAQNEEGWCVAIDPLRLRCTIYEQRPLICREFEMASGACRAERATYRDAMTRAIPLTVR